jgi:hypothetical protein
VLKLEDRKLEVDLQAVTLVIPNTGSGPVNVFAVAFLAKASAFSLPAIPQCLGTHTRVTLLGRACGTHGRGEGSVQGFGWKARKKKKTTQKTKV